MSDEHGTALRSRGGREAILNSAVSNFYALGYRGTSMRNIASDSDLTVASIYHHFTSKQEILQGIMVQVLSDLMSHTRTALMAASPDPREQLAELVRAFIIFHCRRQQEAYVGSTEVRSLDPDGRRLIVALRDEQERMFMDVVDRGVSIKVFATPYPREATRAIVSMGAWVASWYSPRGPLSPEQLAERYVTFALGTVQATEVE
ncbi:MAG: TetR/AcrR family transcriptional regulator [Candidatus Nanopelagicales bacterium]